jgi:erythromycin esterase
LTSFISKNELEILDDLKYQKFISLLKRLVAFDIKSESSLNDVNLLNEVIDSLQIKLSRINESYEVKLWSQELSSLKKEARSVWNPSNLKGMSKFAARDSAMAENLVWLVNNKFKGRKVIVWAASFHIAKGTKYFIKTKHFDPNKIETMGNVVNSLLPNQVYNIGFVSSEGQYSEWYAKDSPNYSIKRSASSFEQILAKTQYDFAFVKMSELTNDKPFNMAGIDYFENVAVWNKIFDGIFYIRVMNGPTYKKK